MDAVQEINNRQEAAEILTDLQLKCKSISADNPVWLKLYNAKSYVLKSINEIAVGILSPEPEPKTPEEIANEAHPEGCKCPDRSGSCDWCQAYYYGSQQ